MQEQTESQTQSTQTTQTTQTSQTTQQGSQEVILPPETDRGGMKKSIDVGDLKKIQE